VEAAISAQETIELSRLNVDLHAGPDLRQWATDLAGAASWNG
jgi:hypothetical protein